MNLSNFAGNGGIIEDTSVMLIINKLELYIENEDRTVQNIKDSLSSLQSYYSGDNDSVIDPKVDTLISSLNVMLDNRMRYVDSLRLIVQGYVGMDQSTAMKYGE